MTRRALFAAIVAVLPASAAADERGSRRMAHDNRRCALIGRHADRRGVTGEERAMMARRGCRNEPGLGWVSSRYYTAEGE